MASAAAAPLIHEGDQAAAISLVVERSDISPSELQPVPLSELQKEPPVLVAGGLAQGCEHSQRPLREVGEALTSAEGSLLYGRFDEAEQSIADARRSILCASAPAPLDVLARIELVAGLIAQERGDASAARERYAAAAGYDPQVPWPSAYPASRRQLFDEAKASLPLTTTTLTFRPQQLPVTLDGQPLPDEVPARVPTGEHLATVGGIAVRIALDEAPNRLVVPGAYPSAALSWAGDEARRSDLSALLAATLGEGTEAWIVHEGTAWRGIAGRTDWTAFPAPSPVLPAPIPVPGEGARGRRWGLTLAGGATALLGGIAVGVGNQIAQSAITRAVEQQMDGQQTEEEYRRARSQYIAGAATVVTGWSLVGIGAGVGGLGLVVGAPR